ncbi:MAG: deoxynucleoside kinase [Anaerolineae bacterium]|nr:deoxynucleoside kinase [Anaerolineae bacterium]
MDAHNTANGRLMIFLEGNIGAGKTTLGRAISQSGAFDFSEEPTTMWREGFASNMLDLFYRDSKRWGFTFQMCALLTRAKTWREVSLLNNHHRIILERSIYCDRFVFAENGYRTGLFSLAEYQLYCDMWEFMVSLASVEPNLIIYLRTPAEVCLQRIQARGRAEESGISLEYLRQLERLHNEWLLDNPKTIVLDGERRWNTEEVLAAMKAVPC